MIDEQLHLEATLAQYETAPKHWRKEFRAMQPTEYKKIMKLRRELVELGRPDEDDSHFLG